ncbi:MAG: ADP-forming succinate--CoA ligase subunit beta [Candidatus Riflebacteria bacterium]|nr:ADP-forming succinate--CoA ligase subunit beta [Candidatus Riflebacteria bacterium]
MKLLEYQAKELFQKFGIPIAFGKTISSIDQIDDALKAMPSPKVVLKAQVYVGGRGKAGGIKLASTAAEAKEKAAKIFGMKIKDCPVNKLLITDQNDIDKELYLSFILDRDQQCYKMIFSPVGGVDIEELAEKQPEKMLIQSVDYFPGLQGFHLRAMYALLKDFPPAAVKEIGMIATNLFKVFVEKDASLAEINPLVLTPSGKVLALDAKVIIDDNALYRQKDLLEYRTYEEDEPQEREAKQKNLNYVKLDGTIGCMVNGAGLAMATMDVIKHFGGEPANFLDIGGGAKAQQVTEALEIILKDPNVKALFVNIFGGIVRCDMVAEGLITAKKTLGIKKPMVIRLVGTNDQKAYELLRAEGITAFATMAEAAKEVVKVAKAGQK